MSQKAHLPSSEARQPVWGSPDYGGSHPTPSTYYQPSTGSVCHTSTKAIPETSILTSKTPQSLLLRDDRRP